MHLCFACMCQLLLLCFYGSQLLYPSSKCKPLFLATLPVSAHFLPEQNFPATPECKLDIGYSALSTTIGCIINYGFYTSGAASPCLNAACLPQINACKANDACWECETSVADTLEYYDLIDGSCENRLANIEQVKSI